MSCSAIQSAIVVVELGRPLYNCDASVVSRTSGFSAASLTDETGWVETSARVSKSAFVVGALLLLPIGRNVARNCAASLPASRTKWHPYPAKSPSLAQLVAWVAARWTSLAARRASYKSLPSRPIVGSASFAIRHNKFSPFL